MESKNYRPEDFNLKKLTREDVEAERTDPARFHMPEQYSTVEEVEKWFRSAEWKKKFLETYFVDGVFVGRK